MIDSAFADDFVVKASSCPDLMSDEGGEVLTHSEKPSYSFLDCNLWVFAPTIAEAAVACRKGSRGLNERYRD